MCSEMQDSLVQNHGRQGLVLLSWKVVCKCPYVFQCLKEYVYKYRLLGTTSPHSDHSSGTFISNITGDSDSKGMQVFL